MAESRGLIDNSYTNTTPLDVDLDSSQSALRAFLRFAQAEQIPSVEDWYTFSGDFDQILENFHVLYPQIWEALPYKLHYNIYQGRELYLPMGAPSSEHEAVTVKIVKLLLAKLHTLRLQPGTSSIVQSFIDTIERRGQEVLLIDNDATKLSPDEQLACLYDGASPIIIEIACTQKFYGYPGLKWKLSREVTDALGNIKVGLGLKIYIGQTAWNPHFTLYRPCYQTDPAGTGDTMRVDAIFENVSLTSSNTSQDLNLTLGDFLSEQSRSAILAKFPGLQNELELLIPITLAEVAAAVAAAKLSIDDRDQTWAATGRPDRASLHPTKVYLDHRNPNSIPGLEGINKNFDPDMEGVGVLQRAGGLTDT